MPDALPSLPVPGLAELPAATTDKDDIVREVADLFDRRGRAAVAKATLGLSPAAIAEAWLDWYAHIAASPGKQLWLGWKGTRTLLRFCAFASRAAGQAGDVRPCIEPLPGDHRFSDPAWNAWPFNLWQQGFLLWQQWASNATTGVHGVSAAHEAVARDGDARLQSLTLFAAQQDFTEAGELTLFINESQVSLLEDMMAETGYLEARQMAGAFQLLRSNDLIWSRMIRTYLLGERETQSDLMSWNADTTRMPAKMLADYLRRLFLDNDLAEGRYRMGGKAIAISDIRVPVFVVATMTDHVAPWRSVHKIHLLCDAEITFVLTSGGHNAGIVSEPGHRGRTYRKLARAADGKYVAPDDWLAAAPLAEGSWWPAWSGWLGEHSRAPVDPPPMGRPGSRYAAFADAPGLYVLAK